MTLWLHAAAHDAECFPRFAVFHHETGNNGVKRTFTGRVNVRVSRLHGKKFATILKHEPEAAHHDTAPRAALIAFIYSDHVASVLAGHPLKHPGRTAPGVPAPDLLSPPAC